MFWTPVLKFSDLSVQSLDLFHMATLVNSKLVCLFSVGILNLISYIK